MKLKNIMIALVSMALTTSYAGEVSVNVTNASDNAATHCMLQYGLDNCSTPPCADIQQIIPGQTQRLTAQSPHAGYQANARLDCIDTQGNAKTFVINEAHYVWDGTQLQQQE